jgi:hypothetical protein
MFNIYNLKNYKHMPYQTYMIVSQTKNALKKIAIFSLNE